MQSYKIEKMVFCLRRYLLLWLNHLKYLFKKKKHRKEKKKGPYQQCKRKTVTLGNAQFEKSIFRFKLIQKELVFNHSKNHQQCLKGEGFSFPRIPKIHLLCARALTWKAASSPPRVISQMGTLPSQLHGWPEDAVASPLAQSLHLGHERLRVTLPASRCRGHFGPSTHLSKHTSSYADNKSERHGGLKTQRPREGQVPGSVRPRRVQVHPRQGALVEQGPPRGISVTAENQSVSRFPRNTASPKLNPRPPPAQIYAGSPNSH